MKITVVLTTFGRSQELLEEALHGFLLQEYSDKKLLIVNIHPTPVIFEHPDVEIQNIEPFEYYGQQAHYALSQVDTPLWCILDSDDIILPWHLSTLYKHYKYQLAHPCQVGYKNVLYSVNNDLLGMTCPNWCCNLYDRLNKDQLATLEVFSHCWYIDQVFYMQDFFKVHGHVLDSTIGYISRQKLCPQMRDIRVEDTCKTLVKEMPGYSGVLQPHWCKDYEQEAKESLRKKEGT